MATFFNGSGSLTSRQNNFTRRQVTFIIQYPVNWSSYYQLQKNDWMSTPMDSDQELHHKVGTQFLVVSKHQFTVFLNNGSLVFLFCKIVDAFSKFGSKGQIWSQIYFFFTVIDKLETTVLVNNISVFLVLKQNPHISKKFILFGSMITL